MLLVGSYVYCVFIFGILWAIHWWVLRIWVSVEVGLFDLIDFDFRAVLIGWYGL